MPAVNSFSHQTGSPLAWSPGSEGDEKEKVGCADYKEVSAEVQEGREALLNAGALKRVALDLVFRICVER